MPKLFKPLVLLETAAIATGDPVAVGPGIHRVEVLDPMGSATAKIQITLDDDVVADTPILTNFKDAVDMTFSEATKKAEVIRGGCWMRAKVETANPTGTIKIIIEPASN